MNPHSLREATEKPHWRLGRGWRDDELRVHLRRIRVLRRNYIDDVSNRGAVSEHKWRRYRSSGRIGTEEPGEPRAQGAFLRAWDAMVKYRFSDPRIVTGYFEPYSQLEGRRMLLEVRILGLRYLCPVVVSQVVEERSNDRTRYGFRYETLQGHLEAGYEWFILTKDHRTGALIMEIQASWRAGDFPNWWSHAGFHLLVGRYQGKWTRSAYRRMRAILEER